MRSGVGEASLRMRRGLLPPVAPDGCAFAAVGARPWCLPNCPGAAIAAAEMATVGRSFQPPKGHFLLFGPRGTGKSTWIKQTWPQALRIDLLAPDTLRVSSRAPSGCAS